MPSHNNNAFHTHEPALLRSDPLNRFLVEVNLKRHGNYSRITVRASYIQPVCPQAQQQAATPSSSSSSSLFSLTPSSRRGLALTLEPLVFFLSFPSPPSPSSLKGVVDLAMSSHEMGLGATTLMFDWVIP
mmetsp:Transcript_41697/g.67104  ORF Transcript_41697/g.67104 Transcript_41697/m.67104 type:complete len:130 (-) Transcript_41697:1157-1546(-)